MTTFELIILTLIYLFCCGYAIVFLATDNESRWDIIIHAVASLFIAFYVPIFLGMQIADKLNDHYEPVTH